MLQLWLSENNSISAKQGNEHKKMVKAVSVPGETVGRNSGGYATCNQISEEAGEEKPLSELIRPEKRKTLVTTGTKDSVCTERGSVNAEGFQDKR